MGNIIYDIFNPDSEYNKDLERRMRKVFDEESKNRGCATCVHCIHVINYPGFVTGEECECNAGLECDTVLHSVKNCETYEKRDWD